MPDYWGPSRYRYQQVSEEIDTPCTEDSQIEGTAESDIESVRIPNLDLAISDDGEEGTVASGGDKVADSHLTLDLPVESAVQDDSTKKCGQVIDLLGWLADLPCQPAYTVDINGYKSDVYRVQPQDIAALYAAEAAEEAWKACTLDHKGAKVQEEGCLVPQPQRLDPLTLFMLQNEEKSNIIIEWVKDNAARRSDVEQANAHVAVAICSHTVVSDLWQLCHLNAAITLLPLHAMAHILRAWVLQRGGNFRKALDSLLDVAQKLPHRHDLQSECIWARDLLSLAFVYCHNKKALIALAASIIKSYPIGH